MSKQKTNAAIARGLKVLKLRKQISVLKQKLEILNAEKQKLETEGLKFMDSAKVDQIRGQGVLVYVGEIEVPTMKDFDKFWNFVRKKNLPELIHHRVSSEAWREHDMNVPGVDSFTRKTLGVRKGK